MKKSTNFTGRVAKPKDSVQIQQAEWYRIFSPLGTFIETTNDYPIKQNLDSVNRRFASLEVDGLPATREDIEKLREVATAAVQAKLTEVSSAYYGGKKEYDKRKGDHKRVGEDLIIGIARMGEAFAKLSEVLAKIEKRLDGPKRAANVG